MKTYTYDQCLPLTVAAQRVPMPLNGFIKLLIAHDKIVLIGQITTLTETSGKKQTRSRYAGDFIVESPELKWADIDTGTMYRAQRVTPEALAFARSFKGKQPATIKKPQRRLLEGRNVYWVQRRLSAPHLTTAQEGAYNGPLSPSHEGRYPWDSSVTEEQHYVRTSLIHLNGGYNFVPSAPVVHQPSGHSSIKAAPEAVSVILSESTSNPKRPQKLVTKSRRDALQALSLPCSPMMLSGAMGIGLGRVLDVLEDALGWLTMDVTGKMTANADKVTAGVITADCKVTKIGMAELLTNDGWSLDKVAYRH